VFFLETAMSDGRPATDPISRRTFAAMGSSLAAGMLSPEVTRAEFAATAEEPLQLTGGVMSGDVTSNAAVIWSRCNRPAQMFVHSAVDATFRNAKLTGPVAADESTGLTAKAFLSDLPAATEIHYRVWFQDKTGRVSAPLSGRFRTAPAADAKDEVFFAWSGDVAGQGFGINPQWGGMKIYDAMRRLNPQFFLHSGDHIYADVPLPGSLPLADGTTWTNVVTAAKSHPAVTLDDFRGNYAYNLLDEHVRRFHSEVPLVVQWDDHETTNNWYPDQDLARRKDAAAYAGVTTGRELAARARQAFFEFMPIAPHEAERERIYRSFKYGRSAELFVLDQRTYRGPNSTNVAASGHEATFLGQKQLQWLKEGLKTSRSTWKIIASDMPIGVIVGDGVEGRPHYEGIANAKSGPASGRELEFADLFQFLKAEGVRNVIWLTADVHYAAAHYYNPERASAGVSFDAFWEFIAGPLHAGTFGPGQLDATFGPEPKFVFAPKAGMTLPSGRILPAGYKLPLAPSDGMQSFGTVRIDAASQQLTVEFRGVDGQLLRDGRQEGRIVLEPV
jgi:alkaline phosphatase D